MIQSVMAPVDEPELAGLAGVGESAVVTGEEPDRCPHKLDGR